MPDTDHARGTPELTAQDAWVVWVTFLVSNTIIYGLVLLFGATVSLIGVPYFWVLILSGIFGTLLAEQLSQHS